jgi:hypothetical protein
VAVDVTEAASFDDRAALPAPFAKERGAIDPVAMLPTALYE